MMKLCIYNLFFNLHSIYNADKNLQIISDLTDTAIFWVSLFKDSDSGYDVGLWLAVYPWPSPDL